MAETGTGRRNPERQAAFDQAPARDTGPGSRQGWKAKRADHVRPLCRCCVYLPQLQFLMMRVSAGGV